MSRRGEFPCASYGHKGDRGVNLALEVNVNFNLQESVLKVGSMHHVMTH